MKYFDIESSINSKCATNIESILNTIALRYIGQNPEQKPVFRIFNEDSFKRNGQYRYILNFDEKYPKAPINSFVYAWKKGMFNLAGNSEYEFKGDSLGAISIYLDGEKIYDSDGKGEFHKKVSVEYGSHARSSS